MASASWLHTHKTLCKLLFLLTNKQLRTIDGRQLDCKGMSEQWPCTRAGLNLIRALEVEYRLVCQRLFCQLYGQRTACVDMLQLVWQCTGPWPLTDPLLAHTGVHTYWYFN
jgi:hypothetical protein